MGMKTRTVGELHVRQNLKVFVTNKIPAIGKELQVI